MTNQTPKPNIDREALESLAHSIIVSAHANTPSPEPPLMVAAPSLEVAQEVQKLMRAVDQYTQKLVAEAEQQTRVDQIKRMIGNALDEFGHERSYVNNQQNIDYYKHVIDFLEKRYELGGAALAAPQENKDATNN